MKDQTDIQTSKATSGEIAIPAPDRLAALFRGEDGGIDGILDKYETDVRSIHSDISTAKGRAEVKSRAMQVRKHKVAMDNAGKSLTEDARKLIDSVNAERKKIEDRMSALAEETRQPLTAWEQLEKDRVARHESAMAVFDVSAVRASQPAAEIAEVIDTVRSVVVDAAFEEYEPIARKRQNDALGALQELHDAAELREQQEREIAELRAKQQALEEAAERDRIQREAEAAEKAALAEAARRKAAAEEAERERVAAAKLAAEEEEKARQKYLAESLEKYIGEVAKGFIGGEPQAGGILLYELEKKVLPEIAQTGPHAARLEEIRADAIVTLKLVIEEGEKRRKAEEEEYKRNIAADAERAAAAEKERAAQEKAEAEARHARELEVARQNAQIAAAVERDRIAQAQKAEEELLAKRAANRKLRLNARGEIIKAIEALGADPADIADALMAGKIPHATVTI